MNWKYRAAFVSALCLQSTMAATASEVEIDGTFKLISESRKILDSNVVEQFEHQRGFVTYKSGRVQVLIVRGNRPKPESLSKMTDQQRIDLFRSVTAYGGTYKFDGKTIEHHIDISWNEVWVGTTQTRDVRAEGDRLIYTTRPAPFSADGKMSVVTLVWEKIK